MQICKLGSAMNANEVCSWMLMRKCLQAMLILMLVILIQILMLLNLNTGYAVTDADLCLRIMSLCCKAVNKNTTACFYWRQCLFVCKILIRKRIKWHDVHDAMSTSKFNLAYLNDVHCTMLMSKFVYWSSTEITIEAMTPTTFDPGP